jgi:hypothetical protein
MAIIFRQRLTFDTWHWIRACRLWPTSAYRELAAPDGHRPASGELCNQCLAKERAGLR